MKVIQLVHNEFEDLELWYPVYRLKEAGAQVYLIGEEEGVTYTGKAGVKAVSDYAFEDVNPEIYDALLIPGGWAPDTLRRFDYVIDMVQHMDSEGKPIGSICHGGWVLVSAGILEGKKVTGSVGIKDDLINAGAEWINEPAVRDGNLVTGRRPPDLPDYMKLFTAVLQEQAQ